MSETDLKKRRVRSNDCVLEGGLDCLDIITSDFQTFEQQNPINYLKEKRYKISHQHSSIPFFGV
jgi:hypothetical protein